jgi:hypothetical protein
MKRFAFAWAAVVALASILHAQPATQPATQPTTQPSAQSQYVRGKGGQNTTYCVGWEPASLAFIDAMKASDAPILAEGGVKAVVFVGKVKGDTSYDGAYAVTADEPIDGMKVTGGSPARIDKDNPGKVVVSINGFDKDGKPIKVDGPSKLVTPQLHLLFPGRTTLPKNLKVLRPGYTSDAQVVTDAYLNLLWKLQCGVLRGMDLQRTNGSTIVEWADVPKVEDARWGVEGKGAPPQVLIDICNKVGCDLWLNIPHGASDDCVKQYARLCRDRLDPKLNLYVEYSNEVWNTFNSIGLNTAYVKNKGVADPECDGPNPTVKCRQWYGKRSAQISAIFRKEFRGEEFRVRPVLSGQAGYPEQLEWSADWVEKHVGPLSSVFHGIAVAPYFGSDPVLENAAGLTAETYLAPDGADGSSRLERAARSVLGGPKMQRFFALARAKNVAALAYEWSDGFKTKGSPDVVAAVNADPRVRKAVFAWTDAWEANGGDVAMHFVAVGNWDRDSSYGAAKSLSPADFGPKAEALALASASRPHPPAEDPRDAQIAGLEMKLQSSERENTTLRDENSRMATDRTKAYDAAQKLADILK